VSRANSGIDFNIRSSLNTHNVILFYHTIAVINTCIIDIVRTMLEAIISFFPSEGAGAIGALEWTREERQRLAREVRLSLENYNSACLCLYYIILVMSSTILFLRPYCAVYVPI
jgi:hypothetical protein